MNGTCEKHNDHIQKPSSLLDQRKCKAAKENRNCISGDVHLRLKNAKRHKQPNAQPSVGRIPIDEQIQREKNQNGRRNRDGLPIVGQVCQQLID